MDARGDAPAATLAWGSWALGRGRKLGGTAPSLAPLGPPDADTSLGCALQRQCFSPSFFLFSETVLLAVAQHALYGKNLFLSVNSSAMTQKTPREHPPGVKGPPG